MILAIPDPLDSGKLGGIGTPAVNCITGLIAGVLGTPPRGSVVQFRSVFRRR